MAIKLELEVVLDDNGAVKTVRTLGTEAEKAGKQASDGFKSGADQLKAFALQAAGAYVGIQTIERAVSRLAQGMRDAALADRQMLGLASSIRALGGNVEQGTAQVQEYATAMRRAGIAEDQTREAIQRLLPAAGSLDNALAAVSVAQGLSIQTGKEMGSIYEVLAQLMAGRVPESVAQFGVVVDKTKTTSEQAADALRQLSERTRGVAASATDAAAAQGRFNELLSELWEGAGRDANGVLANLNGLLRTSGTDLETVAEKYRQTIPLMQVFNATSSALGATTDVLSRALKGLGIELGGIPKVGDVTVATMTDEQMAALALANRLAELDERAVATASAEAAMAVRGRENEAAVRAQDAAIAAMIATMDAAVASQDKLWTRQGGVITPDMVPDEAIPLGERDASAQKEAAREAHLQRMQALMELYHSIEVQTQAGWLAQEDADAAVRSAQMLELRNAGLITEQQYQDALTLIAKAGSDARKDIEAAEKQERQAQMFALLDGTANFMGAMGALAGDNFKKAQKFKIAEAIISTVSASLKALDQFPGPPWTIPNMLATAAMGMARVAQIRSQKPPAYESGTFNVPETGPAILHQGEAVIPRQLNPFSGGSMPMGGNVINVDFSKAYINDKATAAAIAEMVEGAVARGAVMRQVN